MTDFWNLQQKTFDAHLYAEEGTNAEQLMMGFCSQMFYHEVGQSFGIL